MAKKTYWKSLCHRDGKIVSYYDQSEWIVGQWRANPTPIVRECEGLNCSELIVDAMGYVNCEILAQVEIRGATIAGDDKVTAQEMRIIKAWMWKKEDSVAIAIHAAELVIEHYEKQYPNDKRPRQAIEAAKAWLINPTIENQSAAESAAESAESAESAARSAARSAAWSARSARSARSAAWSARSAWSAARSAARSAESAAWSARSAWSARLKMKKKIQKWIINYLKSKESMK